MNEYSDLRATMAHFDILTEPKLILAVICSLVSKLVSNDTIAKATEEVMRAYNELNTKKSITEITSNDTPLFATKVLTDSSLSPIDKGVYSVLCTLADSETLQCSPKVATIARKASCSESSVRKSLATLEKHKVIRRKFRYINHRQIPSLYTVLASQTEACEQNTETQNNAPIVENNNTVEMVSNSTVQADTYFLGDTKNRARPLHEESYALHEEEGEKTLRVFKDSLREGGASLPASAEEESEGTNATIPEEVIPSEKTKDSLTGGALLPISECKNQNPETSESQTSASETNTEKTPFIRAESNGTTAGDNNHSSELSEALLHEYGQLREECTRIRKPTEEPKSITSGLMDIMADIRKRTVPSQTPATENTPMEAEKSPETIAKPDNVPELTVPTDKSPVPHVAGSASATNTTMAEHVPTPTTAGGTPATSTPAQATTAKNVPAPKGESKTPVASNTGKSAKGKSYGKGKRTVSRHPKERYSPEDAPEIMRSTAEYFLYKTGRVALRWEEISVLRTFSATQYPAMVQKEIRRACARFEKNKEPLECLTLMYIAAALKDRPTFGQKGEKKKTETEISPWMKQYMPEKKKELTPEETAAALARLEALEATLNPGD